MTTDKLANPELMELATKNGFTWDKIMVIYSDDPTVTSRINCAIMAQLQKYFRDKHNIAISVLPTINNKWYVICHVDINTKIVPYRICHNDWENICYSSYEEALEEGLIETFKKLIK